MNVSKTINSYNLLVFAAAFLLKVIYLVSSESPSEKDVAQVEELFRKTHPDLTMLELNSLKWDLAANIDEAKLEKACRDVEVAVNPSKLTTYVHPTREKPLQEERVISGAAILFTTGDKNIRHTTLVNCTFSEMQFYLSQGNDSNHVFCFEKDATHNYFRFHSGLHEINKSDFD